jgi:hypothetical protein
LPSSPKRISLVIAILPVEAQIVVNPKPPQFRVLYRTVGL